MASQVQVSGSVRGNFACTWTIEGFSSLGSQYGVCHISEMFQLEEDGKEWYLAIYPGGITRGGEKYVFCNLYSTNYDHDLKWKYNISLCNSNGLVLFDGMANEEWVDFEQADSRHFKTIEAKDLAPQLVEDVLVVILKVTYCVTCVKNGFKIYRHPEIIPLEQVTDDWRKLWTSKRNTDCVVSVGTHDIPVHSLVLSTRSEVFAATFEHETLEKSSLHVDITDFDGGTMESFVEFLYTGNVLRMSSDLALELLRAGDKYQVNNLKSYCTNYLMSVLNDANACQILASADIHNAERLRSHTLEYIWENLSEDDLEAQRSIFKNQPDLLRSAFKQFAKKKEII